MGILSFLFSSSDSGSTRGAKTDGKEIAELKAENNIDASKNLKHAKDIASKDSKTTVIQDNKKERQNRHVRRLNSPYQRRSNRAEKRQPQKRYIEVRNATVKAKDETRKIKKSDNEKIITAFLKQLGPDVQEAVKSDMIKQMSQRQEQIAQKAKENRVQKAPQTPVKLRENNISQTSKDVKALIEEKRGSNRIPKRIKMLKAAKQVAEKARQIVKDFRLRVTGQAKQLPTQKQMPKQKQKSLQKRNIKNFSKTKNQGR